MCSSGGSTLPRAANSELVTTGRPLAVSWWVVLRGVPGCPLTPTPTPLEGFPVVMGRSTNAASKAIIALAQRIELTGREALVLAGQV